LIDWAWWLQTTQGMTQEAVVRRIEACGFVTDVRMVGDYIEIYAVPKSVGEPIRVSPVKGISAQDPLVAAYELSRMCSVILEDS
jgi:hypothetical protein